MINKLPVKKLIEFRRFSERKQSTFAINLKTPKMANIDDGGGGDYWIRSISGLSSAFKHKNNTIIKEKIESLLNDYESTGNKKTKIMYQRNLDILHNYEDFDFSTWHPSADLNFLPKPRTLLQIKNIPIQIIPHHVFSYGNKEDLSVGGVWFVTWLNGFKLGDLGIFSEALFRYLSLHYSKEHTIDPNSCLIIDASNMKTVRYKQILDGEIPSLFETTIDTLNKYLR